MKTYNYDDCYMAKKREYPNQRVCRKFDWRVSPEGLIECTWGIDDQDISDAIDDCKYCNGKISCRSCETLYTKTLNPIYH